MKGMLVMASLLLVAGARADWVPLFNGKDFSNWGGAGKTALHGYEVKEGVLESTPQCRLLSTDKEYADYILEFEFQLTPGANNGLGIHYPGEGDPAWEGMELQILDNGAEKYAGLKDYQYHGSLYSLQAAERGHLKPVGQWNQQRVTVRGDRVSVELNGVCILDADLAAVEKAHPKHKGARRRAGKLVFCGHGEVVRWRKIRIAELSFGPAAEGGYFLPPGKRDDSLQEKGFLSLFDGKTLAGWKGDAEHWLPREGWILHYDGGSEAEEKHLWSEKSFRDFDLVCDWRWAGPGPKLQRPLILPNGLERKNGAGETVTVEVTELDSGIFLRGSSTTQINMWNWPVGSGEVYGIRTHGDHPLPVRAAVTPRSRADRPVGEWNRFVIRMRDERVTVFLNGECVLHEALLPGVKKVGPFALQHHGSKVEFANICVKEW